MDVIVVAARKNACHAGFGGPKAGKVSSFDQERTRRSSGNGSAPWRPSCHGPRAVQRRAGFEAVPEPQGVVS